MGQPEYTSISREIAGCIVRTTAVNFLVIIFILCILIVEDGHSPESFIRD